MKYALALSVMLHLAIFLAPGPAAVIHAPLAAAPLNVSFAAPAVRSAASPAPAVHHTPVQRPAPAATRTTALAARHAPAAPAAESTPENNDAPAPVAARPDEAHSVNQLRALLTSALAAHFRYPRVARQYGWQGRVQVDVRVDTDGQVHPLRVARSSGHSVLDHHALDTLAHIGALPSLVRWLDGKSVDVQVPIVYRLIDGKS